MATTAPSSTRLSNRKKALTECGSFNGPGPGEYPVEKYIKTEWFLEGRNGVDLYFGGLGEWICGGAAGAAVNDVMARVRQHHPAFPRHLTPPRVIVASASGASPDFSPGAPN